MIVQSLGKRCAMVVQELFRVFREGCGKWSYGGAMADVQWQCSGSCGVSQELWNGCGKVVQYYAQRLCKGCA